MSNQRFAVLCLLLLVAMSPPAFAQRLGDSEGRVSFGHDMSIGAEETVRDVACVFCTVRVHGEVRGDVAVLFGGVKVDAGRSIGGDVALVGGHVELGDGALVRGDAAVLGGGIQEGAGASVRGDRVVLPGGLWLIVLPLVPILIFAGIVWLIVWLVRRARYGSPMMRRY